MFALVPAICEEFAFRGFILSGLEHQHRTRSAILLSALMFGFLHVLLSLFQQLFNATLLGIVLGLLAVRSRSILPGLIFHFLNNTIAVSQEHLAKASWGRRIIPGSIASRMRGFIMWRGRRRALFVSASLAVLPVEAEVRATVWGDALLRRGTLTLQARYVLPVEGSPIEDACLTIERGRIAWVGSASEREGDLDLGNVAIVPGFVNAHTHLELEPIETGRPGGEDESEIPWLRRVIDQRRGGTERIAKRNRRAQHQGRDRSGNNVPCRHDDGRTELGADRGGAAASPGVCGTDRPQAAPRARVVRIGVAMAGLGPPRDAGGRLRKAGAQPARSLQHFGLALSQGGFQPDATFDSSGGNARRAAIAQASRRAAAQLP